jgi:Anti-sigma factor NepR
MYVDIVVEGVPERFAAILRRLDEPSDEGSTASSSGMAH